MIVTEGDHNAAGLWIGYAKTRMEMLAASLPSKRGTAYERILLDGVEIRLAIISGTEIIRIKATTKEDAIIIAWMGHATNDFNKKYFDLEGKELSAAEVAARGWQITDDGKYLQVVPSPYPSPAYQDPDQYTYLVNGGGAGIAAVGHSGRDAKQQTGKKVRAILHSSAELLMTMGADYSAIVPAWQFVFHKNSLFYALYHNGGYPRADMARYAGDSAITVFSGNYTPGPDGVALGNLWLGGYWVDEVSAVYRIYKKNLATGAKEYVSIDRSGAFDDAGAQAVCRFYPDGTDSQDILRVNLYNDGSYNKSEPHYLERYSFGAVKQLLGTYHRCADPNSDACYYIRGASVSGGPTYDGSGFTTDSKLQTISNDVRMIHELKHDGSLTYVKIEKNNQMTQMKWSVYCADTLVADSGWQQTAKLHGDDGATPADQGGPVIIAQTRYQIIHSHHGNAFDAVFYKKTVIDSYTSEVLTGYRATNTKMGFTGHVRKTRVRSTTTFHLWVNGVAHEFPDLKFVADEYTFTILSTVTAVGSVVSLTSDPWVDTVGAGNVNCCRAFSSESSGNLLYVFDVYPKTIAHNIVSSGGRLMQQYDSVASGQPWPCSDDYAPSTIGDRKTLLFSPSGNKVIPNFTYMSGGVPVMWERTNGISLAVART